jgi:hypothetical protein
MKFFDDFAWRYADSRDEETCFLLDNNINELRQLATCVIMLTKHIHLVIHHSARINNSEPRTFVLRALPPT